MGVGYPLCGGRPGDPFSVGLPDFYPRSWACARLPRRKVRLDPFSLQLSNFFSSWLGGGADFRLVHIQPATDFPAIRIGGQSSVGRSGRLFAHRVSKRLPAFPPKPLGWALRNLSLPSAEFFR